MQESEDLYKEYQETDDNLVVDKLLSSLSKSHTEKCTIIKYLVVKYEIY